MSHTSNHSRVHRLCGLFSFSALSLIASTSFGGEVLKLQVGNTKIEQLNTTGSMLALDALGSKEVAARSGAANEQGTYIIQFKNHVSMVEQQNLKSAGVEILRYIPDDAYLVRASALALGNYSKLNLNVKMFTAYTKNLKVSPLTPTRSIFNKGELVSVNLLIFRGVDVQKLAEQLSAQGIIVEAVSGQTIAVQTTNEKIETLAGSSAIEWVSRPSRMQLRNFEFQNNGAAQGSAAANGDFATLTGYEHGTKIMGMEAAWSRGLSGQNQVVGISDTGLDTGDMSTIAADFTPAVSSTVAFGYGSTSWADHVGHGTHVSGTVAGRGLLSNGQLRGSAYDSKIVMESLWSEEYHTLTVPKDLGELFQKSYDSGARIHSNSWGDPEKRGVYDAEAGQVDQFMWDHPDMLVLFAAGNDGADLDKDGRVDPGSVSSPATAKNIIAVGASENLVNSGGIQKRAGEVCPATGCLWPAEPLASDTFSNNADGLAAFSSRGPTQDGRMKPDLVAPGTNILSDCSHLSDASALWGRFNADYCYSGGTSMATPLAAGAAAVARQYLLKKSDSPSAALLKATLLNTAHDMFPGQFGEVGKEHGQELLTRAPNNDEGYGRIDIENLLKQRLTLVDEKAGVGTGESKTYEATASVRKITLVYTDYPASPASSTALVNNLDLEVHVGDQVFKSNSTVDNTEQVTLEASAKGRVKIVVVGTNVPMGKDGRQPFALVYSP